LSNEELCRQFDGYFRIFRWDKLPKDARGFDMGCGSGRWATLVAPRVGELCCIDASGKALAVAKRNLSRFKNCKFHRASFEDIPLPDSSMDFGYSIGVLHHIPDTLAGLRSCVDKLKPGAPFLAYIYYALENRPRWFKVVWKSSDMIRRVICRLPFGARLVVSQLIAFTVYLPMATASLALERLGADVSDIPLSAYRNRSFYSMRTDALDRFGTRLEKRFSRKRVIEMFEQAGLEGIMISNDMPYWSAVGYKKRPAN
jgi:SAM-dependent methyltransferase